jgi:membrane fusion protein (multidrug efflux system)
MIGRRSARGGTFLAFLLAGCGGAEGPAGGGFEMPPTPVETAEVVLGPIESVFATVGEVQAAEAVTLVAEIDGTIARVPFREGDPLDEGGLVAQLDDREREAEFRRAEAIRDRSRASYDRVKQVVEEGAAAPQDLDDAEAELRVAEADAALAKVRLEKTRIVAPFDGMIGPRTVSPGAFVRAGDPIARIAQISRLKIAFTMPERYLAEVRRDAEVAVSTPAYPGEPVHGRVDVVDPIVDPATRAVRVIARAANPGGRLRPGMSADVRLVLAHRDSALTVPAEAVFAEGTEFLVYKVDAEGTVARTPVTLGMRLPDAVEILSGLAAGDVVVRAGQQKLYPGAKVMPVGAEGPPPGAEGGAPPADGDSAETSAP